MISTELKPLFDKLVEWDRLFYILPDGRTVWIEVIDDENRKGHDWSHFSVDVNAPDGKPLTGQEFRSFHRLPAVFADLDLPEIALTPDEWHELDPELPEVP